MADPAQNPYAEFQKPAAQGNPYADFQQPAASPGLGSTVLQGAADLGKGLLKGAGGTVMNVDKAMHSIPGIGEWLAPQKSIDYEAAHTVPHGTMQSVGKGIEQAGEFLIPGGLEEKGAATIAEHLPQLGKAAAPLARTAMGGLGAGVMNKAQGGGFTEGAQGGLLGGAVGEGLRSAAPWVAESALGIRNVDRRYGRTPGQAIIEDTSGVRPGTVAKSAQDKLSSLTPDLESAAAASPNSGSLVPAQNVVDSARGTARTRGALTTHTQLEPLKDALTGNRVTGQIYPPLVPARQLLDIKRGIGDDFIHTWSPESTSATTGTGKQAYRALNDEFHAAVPEAKELDQRISSLIPVANRAERKEEGAGLGQRMMGRFGAHTGALGAGLLGFHYGGLPGGIAGVAVPEILSDPTTQMVAARTMAHPGIVTKPLTGLGLQLQRKASDDNH